MKSLKVLMKLHGLVNGMTPATSTLQIGEGNRLYCDHVTVQLRMHMVIPKAAFPLNATARCILYLDEQVFWNVVISL